MALSTVPSRLLSCVLSTVLAAPCTVLMRRLAKVCNVRQPSVLSRERGRAHVNDALDKLQDARDRGSDEGDLGQEAGLADQDLEQVGVDLHEGPEGVGDLVGRRAAVRGPAVAAQGADGDGARGDDVAEAEDDLLRSV